MDTTDGPWLNSFGAGGSYLFRLDNSGALQEQWQAPGVYYDSFPERAMWRTAYGVFYAANAEVPGNSNSVQVFQASDVLMANGFE
jgi:hypothetical protein